MVTPSILEAISGIVESEGAWLHLTISQKLMILDFSEQSALRAREILEGSGAKFKFPKQVYQPRVCVGSRYCNLGLVNTHPFGERIYEKYSGLDIPYKIKIGVGGCPASYAHSTLADIGFIGRKSGYKVFVGGKFCSKRNPFPSIDDVTSLRQDNGLPAFNEARPNKTTRWLNNASRS